MAHWVGLPTVVGGDWFRDHSAGDYFTSVVRVRYHTNLTSYNPGFDTGGYFWSHKGEYVYGDPVPWNHVKPQEAQGSYSEDEVANEMLHHMLRPLVDAIDSGEWFVDPFYDLSQPDALDRQFSAYCTLGLTLRPLPCDAMTSGVEGSEVIGELHLGILQKLSEEENNELALVLFDSRNLSRVMILSNKKASQLLQRLHALQTRIQELAKERG